MRYFYFLLAIIIPGMANAHVKWFSDFNFQQAPLHITQVFSLSFWFLFCLSIISLPLIVYIDRSLENSSAYLKINSFLNRYENDAQLIMRIIMGAVLLMSWQADSLIAPEIPVPGSIWGWAQFVLVFLLLFKETTWITGLGMIFFYAVGISHQGFFHMLDYVIYPAVGFYFIFSSLKNERLRNLDLPILYSGLGLSLCWVAFEKLIYPYWGLSVLAKAPGLTMGLDPHFFLMATSFVEFTLGYLLIICLLQRPLAIVITLVFFTTTVFFGKTEVMGHTILHGALLVFIAKGPGHYYQAPIRFHKSASVRSLFAAVNFIIFFAVMAFFYDKLAYRTYVLKNEERIKNAHPTYEVPSGVLAPEVQIEPKMDSMGGWNLHFKTKNFTFSPENAGGADAGNSGHAHLYVDGEKVARVYGEWFHLNVPEGHHVIKISLTTNSHKDFSYEGREISHSVEVHESREGVKHHH